MSACMMSTVRMDSCGRLSRRSRLSKPQSTFDRCIVQASAHAALGGGAAATAPDPASTLEMGQPNLMPAGNQEDPAGEPKDCQWPSGTTSLMVRNISNRYTLEEVVDEFVNAGFEGTFDFLFMPNDFERKGNLDALVNLRSPYIAWLFRRAFHGHSFCKYATNKVLAITPSVTQGFEALVNGWFEEHAHHVANPWRRPIIFLPRDGLPWQCLSLCEAARRDIAGYLGYPFVDAAVTPRGEDREAEDAEQVVLSDAEMAYAIQVAVARFLNRS